MKNKIDKRQKVENEFIPLLRDVEMAPITISEKKKTKILSLMGERISFLKEDLTIAENEQFSAPVSVLFLRGQELVEGLETGYHVTVENPTLANIKQGAAHFQAILEYEEALLNYRDDNSCENYEEALECYETALDYDIYEEKPYKKILTNKH